MFRDPRVILSKMAPLTVTPDKLRGESSSFVSRKEVELSAEVMELARGIEPPTCGLQNRNRGIAQVIGEVGNPLVIPVDSRPLPFSSICLSLPLISSVCRYSEHP
jgi:hypothetical protein